MEDYSFFILSSYLAAGLLMGGFFLYCVRQYSVAKQKHERLKKHEA